MEFSVVIPTFDRPVDLERCFGALTRLDFPPDAFEVIVVNDGGRSRPEWPRDLPAPAFAVRVLEQPNAGPGAARNLGVRHSRGRWVAFTDDDCTPERDWLNGFQAVFSETPDVLAGGRVLNGCVDSCCSEAAQFIHDAVFDFFNRVLPEPGFFATNNIAVGRDAYLEAGGLDPAFRIASEDRDFCDRWLNGGRRLRVAENAIVKHWKRLSLAGFIRQYFRYGIGAAQYAERRRQRQSGNLGDQLRLHPWLLRCALRRMSGLRPSLRFAMPPLLLLWEVANAAGYFWGRYRRPWRARTETDVHSTHSQARL